MLIPQELQLSRLLYGNLGIRSKIPKTIVIVLSHYRTQATDYLLLNNRTLI